MNTNKYYSVAETAEKLQISKQAVYKRLTTDLKTSLIILDGKKYIKADVIDSLVNSKVESSGFKFVKTNEQKEVEKELIQALKSHIESLEKQNERLNNQIERLQFALMTEQERVKELTLPPPKPTEQVQPIEKIEQKETPIRKDPQPTKTEKINKSAQVTASTLKEEMIQQRKKRKNKFSFKFWKF